MERKRDGLVPIGDAVSGLRSPVTTKPKTKLRDPSTVHLVTASAVTFAPSLWTVTVTKRGPSGGNRILEITKLANLLNSLIKLGEHVWGWAQHFLRVRTASDSHGRSHAT